MAEGCGELPIGPDLASGNAAGLGIHRSLERRELLEVNRIATKVDGLSGERSDEVPPERGPWIRPGTWGAKVNLPDDLARGDHADWTERRGDGFLHAAAMDPDLLCIAPSVARGFADHYARARARGGTVSAYPFGSMLSTISSRSLLPAAGLSPSRNFRFFFVRSHSRNSSCFAT